MRLEGKDIEIRPLDSLDTRKEAQDMKELSFIGYYDLFKDFYEKIDDMDSSVDKTESIERLQKIAHTLFKQQPGLSKDILDSIYRKKDLRENILSYVKKGDENKFEIFLQLKERIPELREIFKKDIHIFLENLGQKMGIEYDIEKVDYLIDNIGIRFFSYDVEDMDRNMAFYSSLHFVGFNLDNKFKDFNYFKKAFYHEFLHVLTNNNERIFSYKDKSNNEYNKGSQISGLRFSGFKNERFTWLNEAVTEQLTINLTGAEQSDSYEKERQLLDLLNKKKKQGSNLDFDSLTKTYFRCIQKRDEDDDSEVDDWKDFSEEMDKAFSPRFLVKLDLLIENDGIDKAIEIINGWEDGDPQVL